MKSLNLNITKEQLIELINQGLTMEQMAEIYHCAHSTIRYHLKKQGLKTLCADRIYFTEKMKKLSSSPLHYNNSHKPLSERFPWEDIQKDYNENKLSIREVCKKYKVHSIAISQARENGLFVKRTKEEESKIISTRSKRNKWSPEAKKRHSEMRKKWLAENPDKHHWRNKDKFKSVPCEKLKAWLKDNKIEFIEEYQPMIEGRFFSIDIAFPDKMIGIEVNGNQHYNRDGTFKEYYQIRHDAIERDGWKLYELHYSICFNIQKITELLPQIINSEKKIEFDYKVYVKPKKEKVIAKRNDAQSKERVKKIKCEKIPVANWVKCPFCDNLKGIDSPQCLPCARKKSQKIHVSKEELEKLIFEMPMRDLAKKFGVSDVGLKKYAKKIGIIIPNMHIYWAKRNAGYSHEKALLPTIKEPPKIRPMLTNEQVISIRNDIKDNMKVQDISIKHGIPTYTIKNLKSGRSYNDIK